MLSTVSAAAAAPAPAFAQDKGMRITPPTDEIDTGALVSELNSYLAAYASASSAPLALGAATSSGSSSRAELREEEEALRRSHSPQSQHVHQQQQQHALPPHTDPSRPPPPSPFLVAPPQLNEPSQYDYTEALGSLLSTLETRRASVRAHMSRLVRGMSDQLELGQAHPSGRPGFMPPSASSSSSSPSLLVGSKQGQNNGAPSPGGGVPGVARSGPGASMAAAVDDLQRGAERCLAALDNLPLDEQEQSDKDGALNATEKNDAGGVDGQVNAVDAEDAASDAKHGTTTSTSLGSSSSSNKQGVGAVQ
ncbi:hypothetical protein OC842_003651 [Tilletia horrida]|uniref:Uncharacterized protein n=1 Tax=Tilletia horrida TaxID=155126 RepID=A0AAN6GB49_9BASI|nr:hypothetical protein OC842_003651 [Tilletia horrida]